MLCYRKGYSTSSGLHQGLQHVCMDVDFRITVSQWIKECRGFAEGKTSSHSRLSVLKGGSIGRCPDLLFLHYFISGGINSGGMVSPRSFQNFTAPACNGVPSPTMGLKEGLMVVN